MAVLEIVEPVIEFREEDWPIGITPFVTQPGDGEYDEWMASISEGWCPPGHPDANQHRLEPWTNPDSGEVFLRCGHGTWFRLVYPNQIEAE